MALEIIRIDYENPQHAADLVEMLDSYACDPMGGGKPLNDNTRDNLASGLAKQPNAFSLIAYVDGSAAGLANCFIGYSTFAAKPLINIHDIVVKAEYRGQGIAKTIFAEIEAIAKAQDACKVTLEVLSGNEPAKALYASLGYGDYALDPAKGHALFWQKELAA
ncbi:GNAT family N-acetyltransferase [Sphingorhabdus arenilitoris]|uniref:GNAT family N-acetyltransferase n=1 Tax=Sphingorhabdus arenilitoris TaxID=1490041 RepID=A0ABV8RHZ7_9SPHN